MIKLHVSDDVRDLVIFMWKFYIKNKVYYGASQVYYGKSSTSCEPIILLDLNQLCTKLNFDSGVCSFQADVIVNFT